MMASNVSSQPRPELDGCMKGGQLESSWGSSCLTDDVKSKLLQNSNISQVVESTTTRTVTSTKTIYVRNADHDGATPQIGVEFHQIYTLETDDGSHPCFKSDVSFNTSNIQSNTPRPNTNIPTTSVFPHENNDLYIPVGTKNQTVSGNGTSENRKTLKETTALNMSDDKSGSLASPRFRRISVHKVTVSPSKLTSPHASYNTPATSKSVSYSPMNVPSDPDFCNPVCGHCRNIPITFIPRTMTDVNRPIFYNPKCVLPNSTQRIPQDDVYQQLSNMSPCKRNESMSHALQLSPQEDSLPSSNIKSSRSSSNDTDVHPQLSSMPPHSKNESMSHDLQQPLQGASLLFLDKTSNNNSSSLWSKPEPNKREPSPCIHNNSLSPNTGLSVDGGSFQSSQTISSSSNSKEMQKIEQEEQGIPKTVQSIKNDSVSQDLRQPNNAGPSPSSNSTSPVSSSSRIISKSSNTIHQQNQIQTISGCKHDSTSQDPDQLFEQGSPSSSNSSSPGTPSEQPSHYMHSKPPCNRNDSLSQDSGLSIDGHSLTSLSSVSSISSSSSDAGKNDFVILHAEEDNEIAESYALHLKTGLGMDNLTVHKFSDIDMGKTEMGGLGTLHERYNYILTLITKNFANDHHKRFLNEILLTFGLRENNGKKDRIVPVWMEENSRNQILEMSVIKGLDFYKFRTTTSECGKEMYKLCVKNLVEKGRNMKY